MAESDKSPRAKVELGTPVPAPKTQTEGKEQGKAVITGNAWAVQENNTMRSNRMTIYLADDGSAKVK